MQSGRWTTSKSGGICNNGCGRDISLPNEIIQHICIIGKCTFNLIGSPHDTSLWSQGWIKVIDHGIEENLAQRWDHFLAELKKAHIILNNSLDELIWALNGER
jgi:hypothetical protein